MMRVMIMQIFLTIRFVMIMRMRMIMRVIVMMNYGHATSAFGAN